MVLYGIIYQAELLNRTNICQILEPEELLLTGPFKDKDLYIDLDRAPLF